MSKRAEVVVEVAGFVAVVVGLALLHVSAALVVGGVVLIAAGNRPRKRRR